MPAERLSMRKVREVLRLKHELGLSYRGISAATGAGKTQAADYVRRAALAGICWPIADGIDDAELERRLFPIAEADAKTRPAIDFAAVQRELKRRSVTLSLLWQEYRAEQPNGYSYTRFCELYAAWCRRVSPTMRQTHVAGDKLFVDWAGDTVAVIDPASGEERRAHIFVAALGASNFTYAEARWSEGLADWIAAHVHAFAAIGGVPRALVPDNLKAGITRPSRYEPGINRTYQELADHYGCVVLPARVRHPRDKAKVEVAVQIVERFVLAKLRNRTFFSLADLNAAIGDCVAAVNAKVMRHVGKSRAALLQELDRPALQPLPATPYAYAEWQRARVAPDYHIEVDAHFYSVPSRLIREIVEARITADTVEIFHKGKRVASHVRSVLSRRHTTVAEHMPSAHRRYAEWTPARMTSEAAKVGPATVALFEAIMKAKPHPEQGFRSCLGIIGLVKSYGPARVEAACRRGNDIGATTYGSIASILKPGLDKAYADNAREAFAHGTEEAAFEHGNIRGRDYYH
jgi:transposase